MEGQFEPLPSEKVKNLELTPDFDGGSFTMVLPKSSRGFTFTTDKNLTRWDENTPNPLTSEMKAKIKAAVPGQMAHTHGDAAAVALRKYRENPTEQNKAEYEKARLDYLDRSVVQVGIRNLRRMGDRITVDTQPVNFPVSNSLNEITSPQNVLEHVSTGATSGSLITKDNRLIVVHRNPKNDPYGDMPGASVAGYFDGTLDKKASKQSPTQGRRTLESITDKSIVGNMLKEMNEELGLEDKDVSKSTITGLALEKRKVHHEFLVDLNLKLTAKEMRDKTSKERELDPQEFAEKFIDIPATPDAIFTLLTKVACPLPPTHYASFAATGYRLMKEQKGERAADEYKRNLEVGIRENVLRIDGIVRKYIAENPQALTNPTARQNAKFEQSLVKYVEQNPGATDEQKEAFKTNYYSNLRKLDPNGYNPFFLPTEQGLPDFNTALRSAGLLGE